VTAEPEGDGVAASIQHLAADQLRAIASALPVPDRREFRLAARDLAAAGAMAQRDIQVYQAADLPRALQAFGEGGLDRVTVVHADLEDQRIEALAAQDSLTTLRLLRSGVQPDGPMTLAGMRSVTSLELRQNDVGDDGAAALAAMRSLTSLDLRDNEIGDAGATAPAQSTSITSLDLSQNEITAVGAAALAANRSITSLNLGFTHVGFAGAVALATNTSITTLNLEANGLGVAVAPLFAGHPSVTSLNLSFNDLTDVGAQALAASTARWGGRHWKPCGTGSKRSTFDRGRPPPRRVTFAKARAASHGWRPQPRSRSEME
jgi:hypothetical protein